MPFSRYTELCPRRLGPHGTHIMPSRSQREHFVLPAMPAAVRSHRVFDERHARQAAFACFVVGIRGADAPVRCRRRPSCRSVIQLRTRVILMAL